MPDWSNSGVSRARVTKAALGLLAALALSASSWGDETAVVVGSPIDVTYKAQASASELAASLRSLDSSLLAVSPSPDGNRVLSAAEHDAMVEAAMKAQIAALANELDLLSASLSVGAHPLIQNALFDRVRQRASVLSRLGARPARVPIPPELTSELLALWRDVEALSASLTKAPGPAADSVAESP